MIQVDLLFCFRLCSSPVVSSLRVFADLRCVGADGGWNDRAQCTVVSCRLGRRKQHRPTALCPTTVTDRDRPTGCARRDESNVKTHDESRREWGR